jgi:thiaminase
LYRNNGGEKKRGFSNQICDEFGISVKCQKKTEEGNFVRKYTWYIIFSILKKTNIVQETKLAQAPTFGMDIIALL